MKKSRCAVHVFDPTLDEATAAQVMAIKGVTFHPYGLGAVDGVVSVRASCSLCFSARFPERIADACITRVGEGAMSMMATLDREDREDREDRRSVSGCTC